jgi:hypothetical protein
MSGLQKHLGIRQVWKPDGQSMENPKNYQTPEMNWIVNLDTSRKHGKVLFMTMENRSQIRNSIHRFPFFSIESRNIWAETMSLEQLHLLFENRRSTVTFQRCIWMDRLFRAETRERMSDKGNAPAALRFDVLVLENLQEAYRTVCEVVECFESQVIF